MSRGLQVQLLCRRKDLNHMFRFKSALPNTKIMVFRCDHCRTVTTIDRGLFWGSGRR